MNNIKKKSLDIVCTGNISLLWADAFQMYVSSVSIRIKAVKREKKYIILQKSTNIYLSS